VVKGKKRVTVINLVENKEKNALSTRAEYGWIPCQK